VPVQPAVRTALHKAAACARDLGYPVEPFQPKGLERAPNLWWFFFGILPARITRELIAGREDQAHWTGTEFLHKALLEPEPTAMKVVENLAVRDKLRASVLREMEDVPVLLLPACGVSAFPHRARRYPTVEKEIGLFEAMMPSTPFNLLGFPGMVIPFGLDSDGLPVGIQLVGRPYDDELLLEIAIRLEEARGPFPAPPGYAD
jgi:Asp-tRNA(Asn)/Glu-tRNA(Gln) amidotransferase A subunit family amidase